MDGLLIDVIDNQQEKGKHDFRMGAGSEVLRSPRSFPHGRRIRISTGSLSRGISNMRERSGSEYTI